MRMFLEPTPAPAGGDPSPQPEHTPAPTPAQTEHKADDNKALLEKIAALESRLNEIGKPTPKPKTDDVPEYVKKQNELIEKLVNQVTSLQTEKTVSARKASLESELKAIEHLPEYYRNEVIEGFETRTFATDADFDTFKKNKVEAAKKIAGDVSAASLNVFSAPITSAGGSSQTKVSSAMADYLKSKNPVQTKN